MKVKGIVSAVSNKGGKYGIKVGFVWFNGNGDAPCNKGDEIEIEYEENGKWNNVSEIKILSQTVSQVSQRNDVNFRANVDAGNILQREIEFINGLELPLNDKKVTISTGTLGEILTEEFFKIKRRIEAEGEIENVRD